MTNVWILSSRSALLFLTNAFFLMPNWPSLTRPQPLFFSDPSPGWHRLSLVSFSLYMFFPKECSSLIVYGILTIFVASGTSLTRLFIHRSRPSVRNPVACVGQCCVNASFPVQPRRGQVFPEFTAHPFNLSFPCFRFFCFFFLAMILPTTCFDGAVRDDFLASLSTPPLQV